MSGEIVNKFIFFLSTYTLKLIFLQLDCVYIFIIIPGVLTFALRQGKTRLLTKIYLSCIVKQPFFLSSNELTNKIKSFLKILFNILM